jgi:transposase
VVQTVKWHLVGDHESLMSFLEGLRSRGVAVEVAVEPTGTYADPLVYQLQKAEFAVYRVSPKHSHDYSEIYDGVPSSHDGKSAAVVAKLHLEKKSRRWTPQSESRRELRAKATQRDWICEEIRRYESRLEALWSRHWPEALRDLALDSATTRKIAATYGAPAALASDAKNAHETLRKASFGQLRSEAIEALIASAKTSIGLPMTAAERDLAMQIGKNLHRLYAEQKAASQQLEAAAVKEPSTAVLAEHVGKNTSAVLVGMLGEFTNYHSVRALQRAAGINLRVRSSGKQKGKLKLAKRGSSVARRWLFLAAMRWVHRQPLVRAWYDRKLSRNGGNKMKALIALMRKLLAGLYHVARGNKLDVTKLFDVRGLALHTP